MGNLSPFSKMKRTIFLPEGGFLRPNACTCIYLRQGYPLKWSFINKTIFINKFIFGVGTGLAL